MKKILKLKLFSIITSCVLILGIAISAGTQLVYAKGITVTGVDDPQVTTMSGEDVTDSGELDRYQSYQVSYNFSIPNGQNIEAGDTASFVIPDNVQVLYDTSFNVTDKDGNVIGTFSAKKGAATGTLTFNDYIAQHHLQDISGTLTFVGNGRHSESQTTWNLNKVGWLDDENKPTWSVVYNPRSERLNDVKIVDSLKGAQTLDIKSIMVEYGFINSAGDFESTHIETSLSSIIAATSKGYSAHWKDLDTTVRISYTSTPSETNGQLNLSNSVEASSDELGVDHNSSSVRVGGNGDISGNLPTSSSSESTSSSSEASSSSSSESTSSSSETSSSSSESASSSSEASSSSSSESTSSSSETSSSSNESSSSSSETSSSSSSESTSSSSETSSSSSSESTSSSSTINSSSTSSSTSSTNADVSSASSSKAETGGFVSSSSDSGTSSQASAASAKNATLPQTGNHAALTTIVGGMLLIAAITLFYQLKKRRQENN